MRTKTKAVRRHSSRETLEGDVSVGTDASVSEVAPPNNLNSCPVSSVVIQGSSNDGRCLVSGNSNWVGALGVAGGLGSFMDVDHTSLSGRMASGITINEPRSVGLTVTDTCHQSLMDVDGTGKGKRKVDDMPMPMHDGSDVGTGSTTFPIANINTAVPDASDVHQPLLSARTAPQMECTSRSATPAMQPHPSVVRPQSVAMAGDRTFPSASPLPSSAPVQSRRCASQRRQTRGPARAPVNEEGHREIWYSWRHQMIAVAKAGYRAIAPDFRGYGLSDPPQDIKKFCFSNLVDDVLAMVDLLAIDKIFIIAKDFGVRPAFLFALLYPTRVAGVVSLGVPHTPFGPRKFHIELPEGFYINRWKEPGRAEADFARLDAKTVVRNVYILFSRSEIPVASKDQEIMDIVSPSTPLPSWFTEADLSVYGALYEKSRFLNSLKVPYRSADEVYDIQDQVIKNPMLVILGEKDYFLKFPGVEDFIKSGAVNQFASNLEIEYVPEGSHFVQEQFPDKINSLILAFLNKHS